MIYEWHCFMYLNSRDMSMSNNAMVWLLKWELFKQPFFMECVWKVAINLFTLTLEQKGKRVGTKKMFQAKWLRIYWLVDTRRPQIVIRWLWQYWSFRSWDRKLVRPLPKNRYVKRNFSIFWKGTREGSCVVRIELIVKFHIFWESHKILWNLHLTFDCMYCSQK